MDGQLSFATLDYAGKKKRTKRDANGGWCIDPAEFHRTFPPLVMAGAEQPPKQQDATDAMVALLREQLADPVKMITSVPAILGYAIKNVRDKIADLRELGFTEPVKMITTHPAILSYAIKNVRGKIADLRELGFADPVKMMTSNPATLSYAIDNVRSKIAVLRELGFADPVKLVTTLPAILGYAIDSIRGKIAVLREFGFADPVTIITSHPAILGYARERLLLCGQIVRRLEDDKIERMFMRLIKQQRAVIDAVAIAEPRTWSEVRVIIVAAKGSARR